MKKNKLNSSGFVLMETLIVTVFIMAIFAILYNNFYPLIGEYEKREAYDDVDGKYAAYWFKRVIQDSSTNIDKSKITSDGYIMFNCEMVTNDDKKRICNELVKETQVYIDNNGTEADTTDDIPHIYVTEYKLVNFKSIVDSASGFTGGMHRYVEYLPNYMVDSLNGAKYRVIIEFYRTKDENDYLAYSTIEVKK